MHSKLGFISKVWSSRRYGQGMVEFAIIIPIVLLMILGVIEGGHFLFFYSTLSAASREAARYGEGVGTGASPIYYQDCDGIREAANRIGVFANVQLVTISYDSGGGTTPFATCGSNYSGRNAALGDRVVVSVTGRYEPIVPLVPFHGIDLTSVSTRTIVSQALMEVTGQPTDIAGNTCGNPSALPVAVFTGYDIISAATTPVPAPTPTPIPTYDLKKVYIRYSQDPEGPDVKAYYLYISWTDESGQKLTSARFGGRDLTPLLPSKTCNGTICYTQLGDPGNPNATAIIGLIAGKYQYLILTFQKNLPYDPNGNSGLPIVTTKWTPNPACAASP